MAAPDPAGDARGATIADEHALLDDLRLRDALTRDRLTGAGDYLADLEVLDFDSQWWDGQAHVPCLVVRGGRGHRLQRIVETGGECLVVPFDRRDAAAKLARRRRPTRPELVVPEQRAAPDVVVDASSDAVRCAGPECGALLPIDYEGACPLCGD